MSMIIIYDDMCRDNEKIQIWCTKSHRACGKAADSRLKMSIATTIFLTTQWLAGPEVQTLEIHQDGPDPICLGWGDMWHQELFENDLGEPVYKLTKWYEDMQDESIEKCLAEINA